MKGAIKCYKLLFIMVIEYFLIHFMCELLKENKRTTDRKETKIVTEESSVHCLALLITTVGIDYIK
jgi:hypothetical protein